MTKKDKIKRVGIIGFLLATLFNPLKNSNFWILALIIIILTVGLIIIIALDPFREYRIKKNYEKSWKLKHKIS